jgi:hypothetical protein
LPPGHELNWQFSERLLGFAVYKEFEGQSGQKEKNNVFISRQSI